jgi:hypothetical protein
MSVSDDEKFVESVPSMLRMRAQALALYGRNTVVVSIEKELDRLGFDLDGKPVDAKKQAPAERQAPKLDVAADDDEASGTVIRKDTTA